MYKRALLLTAATVALMSGPAFAAGNADITTKVTTPVKTSTASATGTPSDILIELDGSVVVTAPGGGAAIIPAATIDSNNIITNKGTIQFTNAAGAVGVQLNAGFSGALDSTGTIDLTGSGDNKVGILITAPTGSATTVFTGVALPDATTPLVAVTAIDLEAGSALKVTGDDSTGILLDSTASLTGDINIAGTILMNPTTVTSTTGGGDIGVSLAGNMTGNFIVSAGGSITVIGTGAQGYVQTGILTGAFENNGSIEAIGTLSPSATATNPASLAGVLIENNITGGILNAGPISSSGLTARATISESGGAPALLIHASQVALVPLEIGEVSDITDPNYALLNRGQIASASPNPNVNTAGIAIVGNSPSVNVVLDGLGIFNGGTITGTSTDDSREAGNVTTAGGVVIGQYAVVQSLDNSNQSGAGTISASVTGTSPAIATAVDVQTFGSLTSITNSGTISASASTSDPTIANLSAFAIRDETVGGTITTITNSGTITALTSTLDDGLQVAAAVDLVDSGQNVTFTNSGTVTGAVILGTGNDVFTISGTGVSSPAVVAGNINFGGGADTLMIGSADGHDPGRVTGAVQEQVGGSVAVTINPGSFLSLRNDGTQLGSGAAATVGLPVSSMEVADGGTLGLTLAQVFNVNAPSVFAGPVVFAPSASGTIDVATGADMTIQFGSFIGSTNTSDSSQFVLLDARGGNLTIGDVSGIANQIAGPATIPFLFTGSVCTFNVAGSPVADQCTGAEPISTTDSELILNLAPKTAAQIGLTGYALKMFTLANAALANDNTLGAAVISAGAGITNAAVGQALYEKIYSSFAPDVTGSQRALAIALTDQATGAVGARQRALRMYAGQDGEATLWGQEFTQTLNVGNQVAAAGYKDTGFGFALGMDGGSPIGGRYGGAFTFYSGDTSEKAPRDTKTTSEFYMMTGYTDWRGKGFFLDSQLNLGYGNIDGKRQFDFGNVTRVADGKRAATLLSGGVTAGVALTSGGTVIMPQVSVDGLAMRQEGFTESNGGATSTSTDDGFDLHVHSEHSQSLRTFAGLDIRQDLNFGDFYLQPEVRMGYRYDFSDAMEKIKAEFVSVPTNTFSITGPDPAKGNVVVGGSIATTTGAWSIGLNYDYLRGVGGTTAKDSISQSGTITLVGRI